MSRYEASCRFSCCLLYTALAQEKLDDVEKREYVEQVEGNNTYRLLFRKRSRCAFAVHRAHCAPACCQLFSGLKIFKMPAKNYLLYIQYDAGPIAFGSVFFYSYGKIELWRLLVIFMRRSKVRFAPAYFLSATENKPSARFLAPPLSQKVTLGSPVRL